MKKPLSDSSASPSPPSQRKHFTYSIASVGIFAAIFMFLIVLAAAAFNYLYYRSQLREQYLEYSVRIQSQINNDTASSFRSLEQELFMLGVSDVNVSLMNTTQDQQTFYRAKMALYNTLSNLWPPYKVTDGLFFYSPAANDYTQYVARNASVQCSNYIKKLLTESYA